MPERISRSDGFLFPVTSGSAPMFATVTVCEKSEYLFRRFHRSVPDKRVVFVIEEIESSISLRDMRRTFAGWAP